MEFFISAALDMIVALKFQRDVVWPALRAFDKTVVKSRHESCGIYTKNLFTAERVEVPEIERMISLALPALSAFSEVNPASYSFLTPIRCI
jgi:hypothetical protein